MTKIEKPKRKTRLSTARETGKRISPTRRETLGLLGVAGATAPFLLTSACGSKKSKTNVERHQVVVIGAGLSGLNAAMLLEEQGLDVLVLEAMERVGGRLHTRDDLQNRPEAGGYTLGDSYARVRYRCDQLGIKLRNQGRRVGGWCINIDGENVLPSEWETSPLNKTNDDERSIPPWALAGWYGNRLPSLDDMEAWRTPAAHDYDVPLSTLLSQHGASPEAIRLMEWNANAPNFSEFSSVGTLRRKAVIQTITDGGRSPGGAYNVADGSARLPEAMAASLNRPVKMSEPVISIDQSKTPVRITTEHGVYDADYVICAVPFTAARNIDFAPALPAPLNSAINEARYVATSIVHLQPTEQFWKDDGLPAAMWTDGPIGRVFKFWDDPNIRDNNALTVWVTGDACAPFDEMSPGERAAFIKSELTRMRPASEGKIEIEGEDIWNTNPYFGGAYHMFAPGQVKSFGAALTQPAGRVHFAGEHTAVMMVGMEAAMESGERAALQIAEAMGIQGE